MLVKRNIFGTQLFFTTTQTMMLPTARPDLDKHIKILAIIPFRTNITKQLYNDRLYGPFLGGLGWRQGMTVTLHNRVPFTTTEVRRRRVELQCGMLTNPWQIPSPVWVLAPGYRLTVGCTDGPDRMLSAPFAGGCSSTRRDISPQTRRWAPSSVKWKAWATPTSTEARGSGTSPTTSSPPRLVGRRVCWSQLGPVGEAGMLNLFVTGPLIGQRFACRLLRVTVTAVDGTAVNVGQTKRQRNHESNCPRESTSGWLRLPWWRGFAARMNSRPPAEPEDIRLWVQGSPDAVWCQLW